MNSPRTSAIFIRDNAPRALVAKNQAAALREIASVIAECGSVLTAPTRTPAQNAKPSRIIPADEIAATPSLRDLASRLPDGMRLVIVEFSDGAGCITAAPHAAGDPPANWIAAAYTSCVMLPTGRSLPSWWPLTEATS